VRRGSKRYFLVEYKIHALKGVGTMQNMPQKEAPAKPHSNLFIKLNPPKLHIYTIYKKEKRKQNGGYGKESIHVCK
jgi:hypothetical protein